MEWIKCSDRLPADEVPVLVTDDNEYAVASIFCEQWIPDSIDATEGDRRGYGMTAMCSLVVSFDPTPWMPLPKGPTHEDQ